MIPGIACQLLSSGSGLAALRALHPLADSVDNRGHNYLPFDTTSPQHALRTLFADPKFHDHIENRPSGVRSRAADSRAGAAIRASIGGPTDGTEFVYNRRHSGRDGMVSTYVGRAARPPSPSAGPRRGPRCSRPWHVSVSDPSGRGLLSNKPWQQRRLKPQSPLVLVVVAVMGGVAAAVVEIVDVIAVGYGHVAASGTVDVAVAVVDGMCAGIAAFVVVAVVHAVNMPVVHIVDVIAVRERHVAASVPVYMVVFGVFEVGCGAHLRPFVVGRDFLGPLPLGPHTLADAHMRFHRCRPAMFACLTDTSIPLCHKGLMCRFVSNNFHLCYAGPPAPSFWKAHCPARVQVGRRWLCSSGTTTFHAVGGGIS